MFLQEEITIIRNMWKDNTDDEICKRIKSELGVTRLSQTIKKYRKRRGWQKK